MLMNDLVKPWCVPFLLLATIGVVVFWSGGRMDVVKAQSPKPSTGDLPNALSLAYVPRDALVVFGARPSLLATKPALASVAAQLHTLVRDDFALGFSPDEVEELVFGLLSGERIGFIAIVRTTHEQVLAKYWQANADKFVPAALTARSFSVLHRTRAIGQLTTARS